MKKELPEKLKYMVAAAKTSATNNENLYCQIEGERFGFRNIIISKKLVSKDFESDVQTALEQEPDVLYFMFYDNASPRTKARVVDYKFTEGFKTQTPVVQQPPAQTMGISGFGDMKEYLSGIIEAKTSALDVAYAEKENRMNLGFLEQKHAFTLESQMQRHDFEKLQLSEKLSKQDDKLKEQEVYIKDLEDKLKAELARKREFKFNGADLTELGVAIGTKFIKNNPAILTKGLGIKPEVLGEIFDDEEEEEEEETTTETTAGFKPKGETQEQRTRNEAIETMTEYMQAIPFKEFCALGMVMDDVRTGKYSYEAILTQFGTKE